MNTTNFILEDLEKFHEYANGLFLGLKLIDAYFLKLDASLDVLLQNMLNFQRFH